MLPEGNASRHLLRTVARSTGARFQEPRLRDGTLIVKLVWGRRTAMFRVVDDDAFDPARSGLALAAWTGGLARGGRDLLVTLDRVLLGRSRRPAC